MKYTLDERLKKAEELRSRGYNCAQAVAGVFDDVYDIDPSVLLKIAEPFGGGMAMNSVCGAVTGMFILAGLENADGNVDSPKSKKDTYSAIRGLKDEFTKRAGSHICRELKGMENKELFRSCDDCICDAIIIYHNALAEEKQTER